MDLPFADVLSANDAYASTEPRIPGGRPARALAVVTCMDTRIDPLAALGLAVGDAVVLRNPGGRVTADVLTALVVAAHELGVRRVLIMPHTDCAMTKKNDAQVQADIAAAMDLPGCDLPIGTTADQPAALAADVAAVRASGYLPDDLEVAGAVFDVRTGRLIDPVT